MSASNTTDAGPTDVAEHRRRAIAAIGPQSHYIDGEARGSISGATFETVDPATGEVLAGPACAAATS